MVKNDCYYFHQTPSSLAIELIKQIPLEENDVVLEPFKGEGAFYNNFPSFVIKEWCEIEEGRDYKTITTPVDWVISNPPFRLETTDGKRINSFFTIIEYYAKIVNKGMAFLANDYCFATLTPIRLKTLNSLGLYIKKIVVCNVKKWRGRYFFIIFEKQPNNFYTYLNGSY